MGFNPQTRCIPRDVVASVVSSNGDRRLYTLWKNGQIIVIEADTVFSPSQLEGNNISTAELMELGAKFIEGLEHIQTLVHTIEFGSTNWGYLTPNRKGGFKILQKQKRLPQVQCPTWAQFIPWREINFVKFWDNMWTGYWNGREIDVLVAFDDCTIRFLDREMQAHHHLEGLDLTYQVVGHVFDENDTIMGLAYEPHSGRLMKYTDKSIVYDALSRVQERGLIYHGAAEYQNTHIVAGKVRLTNLCSIWDIRDEMELEELGNIRHWQSMDELFSLMRAGNDNTIRPVLHRRLVVDPLLLPRFSPGRPIIITFDFIPCGEADREQYYAELLPWLNKIKCSRKPSSYSRLVEGSDDSTCIELTSPALGSMCGPSGFYSSGSESDSTLVEKTYFGK